MLLFKSLVFFIYCSKKKFFQEIPSDSLFLYLLYVQCTLYSTVCMHTIEKANFYKLQIGQHFLNTNKYENKNYVFFKWRFKFPKITNSRS